MKVKLKKKVKGPMPFVIACCACLPLMLMLGFYAWIFFPLFYFIVYNGIAKDMDETCAEDVAHDVHTFIEHRLPRGQRECKIQNAEWSDAPISLPMIRETKITFEDEDH